MRQRGKARSAAILFALTLVAAVPARAAEPTDVSPSEEVLQVPEIVVTGQSDTLLGTATAASQGTVSQEQLSQRTLLRPGEVLEAVPGVIITQHSGGGKANQYFLRGFNLDHGTDFATSLDGMPVNLPTHAHGQGYSDLNILIPELVERVDFRKGVYYADLGDFSSAGGADIRYVTSLPQSLAQVEGGSFGYGRGLFASSPRIGPGTLLYAVELFHSDGPWKHPDDYRRINGVLRYSQGTPELGFSLTTMAYAGAWDATDQIAARAPRVIPGFGRYDSLDTSDGGTSGRYSLTAEWHRVDAKSTTKALVYGFYYDLDLFSNFTYVLDSPQGDQFEQRDRRWVGGTKLSQTWFGTLGAHDVETTVGLQARSDVIHNGLYQTVGRHRTDKLDYTGAVVPATTRADDTWEASLSPYVENKIKWAEKVRSILGLRVDGYHVHVTSDLPENSGSRQAALASPKGSLVFGPWARTEVYLSGGLGFHSNDARGATTRVDPSTGDPVPRADLLVRTYGAEVGVRTTAAPGLQSTLAFWWLDIDSELVFVGDAGTTAPSAPSRRYGVEWANFYRPLDWLTLDAQFSLSHAEFRRTVVDGDTGLQGRSIPEAVQSVVAAGIGARQAEDRGLFGELRLRYFGPRPLTVDDSVHSGATVLVSAKAGYKFNKHWTLSVEGFNLLNRKDHDIDYYYPSRLPGEPAGPNNGGFNDIHYKLVEPFAIRAAVQARFW